MPVVRKRTRGAAFGLPLPVSDAGGVTREVGAAAAFEPGAVSGGDGREVVVVGGVEPDVEAGPGRGERGSVRAGMPVGWVSAAAAGDGLGGGDTVGFPRGAPLVPVAAATNKAFARAQPSALAPFTSVRSRLWSAYSARFSPVVSAPCTRPRCCRSAARSRACFSSSA